MSRSPAAALSFAAICAVGTASALAVDLPDPTYTYCEIERAVDEDRFAAPTNDQFSDAENFAAPSEFADCFYITGKLQKDCVWDRQPKCCVMVYDKPTTAYDDTGRNIGLVEEVIAMTDPFVPGPLLAPILDDGTLRIGVTAIFDCFDGTMNGLFSNDIHGEIGEVCISIAFTSDPLVRSEDADEHYTFRFEEGREAIRLAYTVQNGAQSAVIICDEYCGEKEICYDTDFYWVEGLTPRELYCITQVGGKTYDCEATDTVLGWFDKNGNQQGGPLGISKTSAANNVPEYAELCVIADDLGHIRFAISGCLDENFNGLDDSLEEEYFEWLEDMEYLEDTNNVIKGEGWIPGASTKANPEGLIRLSREDFDEYPEYQCPPAHGECGCYTLKVRLNEHFDDGDDDDDFGGGGLAARADMSGDGFVDAIDLAMLLSFWGPVQ